MLSTIVPSMSKISARTGSLIDVILEQSRGRGRLDPPGGDVDHRREGFGEGQENGPTIRGADIEQIACAIIVDRCDGAERLALRIRHGAADQVGLQKLVL